MYLALGRAGGLARLSQLALQVLHAGLCLAEGLLVCLRLSLEEQARFSTVQYNTKRVQAQQSVSGCKDENLHWVKKGRV